jgi:hypothetical protein
MVPEQGLNQRFSHFATELAMFSLYSINNTSPIEIKEKTKS